MKNLMKSLKSGTKVIITGNTSDHNFDIGQEVFFDSLGISNNKTAILNCTEESDSEFWSVNLIDFCTVEDFKRTQMLDKVQNIINSQEPDNTMQLRVMAKRIENLENALTKIISICEDSQEIDDIHHIANKALYL